MYHGKASAAASYFKSLGCSCPAGINAGEFVVDLVSRDYTSEQAKRASDARIQMFAEQAASSLPPLHPVRVPGEDEVAREQKRAAAIQRRQRLPPPLPSRRLCLCASSHTATRAHTAATQLHLLLRLSPLACRSKAPPWIQFSLLFGRAWREVARSRAAIAIKVVQQARLAPPRGSYSTSPALRVYQLSHLAAHWTGDGRTYLRRDLQP